MRLDVGKRIVVAWRRRTPVKGPVAAACAASAVVAVAAIVALGPAAERVGAERVLREGMIIAFDGDISPKTLPRRGQRPVRAQLSGRVRMIDGSPLPQLRRLRIEINRHAVFAGAGLPICKIEDVSDAFVTTALENCGDSLIGSGSFGVQLSFPDQRPVYARGRALAFHSRVRGRQAVLMHIVTVSPAAVAITVPLIMSKQRRGEFGLLLSSPPLPELIGHYIYTTDFSFTLGRLFEAGGRQRSYLSAGCPAPAGFPGAVFNLARATYEFSDGRKIRQTLTRNCRVRGG